MRLMAVCYSFGKLVGGCGAAVLLSVVCCLLFAVCCLLFAVCSLLSAVCCLLSVVCCLLFADCFLLSAVCCLLAVVSCLLFAVCCLLFAVCRLLSAVCCLLLVVCCLLSTFVICSLFVRCLFTLYTLSFRSLFVLCSSSVCCRHLFASCMPAAVGRKIKYRFHAWQAPEVFSKRQPLIFSHYLCLCGSFFSSRICGIYVRPPSVLLPSAIQKVPGEMPFLHHLLEFVISRPAPGVSLASPAREPHPEGAGRNGLSPPPSRIRYKPTCPRCLSRQPYPGCPSERCRQKQLQAF